MPTESNQEGGEIFHKPIVKSVPANPPTLDKEQETSDEKIDGNAPNRTRAIPEDQTLVRPPFGN